MGLWDELECSLPPANPFHRAVRAAAARRPVSRVLGVALHPLDRFVSGATQGRQSATQYVSGLPTITLVTVGARSGERRHTPLLAFPREGDIAVIGSNYGRERTPGWVHNVRANPEVEVEHAGRTVAAVAKRLGREAAAEVYEQAQREYPGYASYRTWAGGRDITVWLLVTRDA
jgi:deazaflavin-dependent oxidoreductase (nitroreductase family)